MPRSFFMSSLQPSQPTYNLELLAALNWQIDATGEIATLPKEGLGAKELQQLEALAATDQFSNWLRSYDDQFSFSKPAKLNCKCFELWSQLVAPRVSELTEKLDDALTGVMLVPGPVYSHGKAFYHARPIGEQQEAAFLALANTTGADVKLLKQGYFEIGLEGSYSLAAIAARQQMDQRLKQLYTFLKNFDWCPKERANVDQRCLLVATNKTTGEPISKDDIQRVQALASLYALPVIVITQEDETKSFQLPVPASINQHVTFSGFEAVVVQLCKGILAQYAEDVRAVIADEVKWQAAVDNSGKITVQANITGNPAAIAAATRLAKQQQHLQVTRNNDQQTHISLNSTVANGRLFNLAPSLQEDIIQAIEPAINESGAVTRAIDQYCLNTRTLRSCFDTLALSPFQLTKNRHTPEEIALCLGATASLKAQQDKLDEGMLTKIKNLPWTLHSIDLFSWSGLELDRGATLTEENQAAINELKRLGVLQDYDIYQSIAKPAAESLQKVFLEIGDNLKASLIDKLNKLDWYLQDYNTEYRTAPFLCARCPNPIKDLDFRMHYADGELKEKLRPQNNGTNYENLISELLEQLGIKNRAKCYKSYINPLQEKLANLPWKATSKTELSLSYPADDRASKAKLLEAVEDLSEYLRCSGATESSLKTLIDLRSDIEHNKKHALTFDIGPRAIVPLALIKPLAEILIGKVQQELPKKLVEIAALPWQKDFGGSYVLLPEYVPWANGRELIAGFTTEAQVESVEYCSGPASMALAFRVRPDQQDLTLYRALEANTGILQTRTRLPVLRWESITFP